MFSIRDVIVLIYLRLIYSASLYKYHFIISISHHEAPHKFCSVSHTWSSLYTQSVSTLDAVGFFDAFLTLDLRLAVLLHFRDNLYCKSRSLPLIFKLVMYINIYFLYPPKFKHKIFMTLTLSRAVLLHATPKLSFYILLRLVAGISTRKYFNHARAGYCFLDKESKAMCLSPRVITCLSYHHICPATEDCTMRQKYFCMSIDKNTF